MANDNSEQRNSERKTQNSVKDLYKMTEKYENGNNNQKSGSNECLNKPSELPLKTSSEISVDINDNEIDDQIPEEIWEQEVQVTERKPNPSQPSDKPQDQTVTIDKSFVEQNQQNISPSKGIGSIVLCFGYKISEFKWTNIIYLVILHTYAIYAYGYALMFPVRLLTVIWTIVLATCSGFGASAGAHRLWAHRAYKARGLLKGFLIVTESMAVNGSCYSYARDHRNHHKYVDTDADPKNARRGFFFAHIGWWCVKKNDQVIRSGQKLPKQDLLEDGYLMFQHRFYYPLVLFWGVLFPVVIPYYIWSEDFWTAFNVCVVLRVVFTIHHLFTVNSIAHIFGKSLS